MKIELKRISFSERMSEETYAFTADLYINGKKVGECKNTGQGGCTDYYGIKHYHSDDIQKAEAYCKTLPKVKYGDSEWEESLEGVINQLLEDWLKAKDQKKLERKMLKAIYIGLPNSDPRSYYGFKVALSTIPTGQLQASVDRIKAKLENGEVILNTNLEALGINV